MKRTVLLLTLMAAFVSLAGCSKDKEEDPTVSKLEVVLDVETISKDILDYFDVTYTYVDFNGKTASTPITGPADIKFHIDNPQLGYNASTPFSVALTFTQKNTTQKESGNYDSSLKYQLDVNAYDQNGKLITDSGKISSCNSNIQYDGNKFSSFINSVKSSGIKQISYLTFFCKTDSGIWHIGVEGIRQTEH